MIDSVCQIHHDDLVIMINHNMQHHAVCHTIPMSLKLNWYWSKLLHNLTLFMNLHQLLQPLISHPCGLTFTWWGCCGLSFWRKPTELAHSLLFRFFVPISVFMALSTVFHSINSHDNSPFSHSILRSYLRLIGPFNYISLYESFLQPWYNPLWLTGLKTPIN